MKMKKAIAKVHTAPTEYRIKYKINDSVEESVQYYNVFHSSEALDFLAHTLRTGHIHGSSIEISAIEEWCRFRNIWIDRIEPATKYAESEELGKSILIKNQNG